MKIIKIVKKRGIIRYLQIDIKIEMIILIIGFKP